MQTETQERAGRRYRLEVINKVRKTGLYLFQNAHKLIDEEYQKTTTEIKITIRQGEELPEIIVKEGHMLPKAFSEVPLAKTQGQRNDDVNTKGGAE